MIIEGDYHSGKSKLIPTIIKNYMQITETQEQRLKQIQERKQNFKTYTVAEIIANGSSSEDDSEPEIKKKFHEMKHFPWL